MQTPAEKTESDVGGNRDTSGDSSSSRIQADMFKYRMKYPRRGKFIIINNKTFKTLKKPKLNDRTGTDVDSRKLKDLFEKVLQFEVEVHDDLTSGQMEQVIASEAEIDHHDCDCFGVAILTYEGEEKHEGKLYGTDCEITIERLLEPIKMCKSLHGKPKLCFIQACKPVEENKMKVEPDAPGQSLKKIRLPIEADFLYVYSTVPGVYSWKESDRGSWFIEALTDKLTELAYEDIDLVRILTRVINQVAHDMSNENLCDIKVPSITSMLTNDLYFTKKPASSS